MSPDILLKIETALKASNLLTNSQLTLLCSKLSSYERGSIIFPSIVKRHLGVSLAKSYEILNVLVDVEILKVCFQLQCGEYNCSETYRHIFDEINEIPKWLTCEHCGSKFNIVKDTKVIFKVK
ncbi:hypothetical protein GMA92_05105 [Turicibacter sanguinis]|uniref:Uncharacterized protein n=1 Tax=Turicibacter sanguinis TaxID=154288 RepID=A0A9X4XCL2_9FIRM|nr:hypothetical protein [Turicibacter sanguinis]MTK72088.1 hypothetical protein [Turicibacter sanguinis]MTP74071.1 hypothetical protein [Turicibacter sanguinis]